MAGGLRVPKNPGELHCHDAALKKAGMLELLENARRKISQSFSAEYINQDCREVITPVKSICPHTNVS